LFTKRNIRIAVVILSSVVVFGVLYAGNIWLTRRTVMQPLERSLREIAGVTDVKIAETSTEVSVNVKMGAMPDLRTAYLEIDKHVKDLASRKQIDLHIEDRRSPALEDAYYNIHFDVQQAIATGGFAQMADNVGKKMKALGIEKYRVFVDSDDVYVQMQQGSDYLYEVVPRPETTVVKPATSSLISFDSLGLKG